VLVVSDDGSADNSTASEINRFPDRKGPNVRMKFGAPGSGQAQHLWAEKEPSDQTGSFVYVAGWCYRVGAPGDLTATDYLEMLDRQRRGLAPCGEAISGTYVAVVYDLATGLIVVQPDRWAMRSAYYAISDGRIAVSSRSLTVADVVGAAIDGHSVLALIRNALHMPLGHSLFDGVHRVLCGCYLAIDTRKRQLSVRRWVSNFVPVRKGRFSQFVEELREGLRPIARRLADCRSAVFDLTGGNDTRLMAAMMSSEFAGRLPAHLGWNVVGPEDDEDVVVARRVAAACGWELRRLDRIQAEDTDLDELIAAAVTSDGTFVLPEAFSRIRLEQLERGDWEWLVGGFAAEPLRGYWWKQEFLRLGRPQVNYGALLDYRIRPSTTIDTKSLGAEWPSLQEHNEVLLGAYRRIESAVPGIPNARKIDAFYMHRLTYSGGNSHSWVAGLREVRLPFVSSEFMSQVLSIPWRLRVGRRLMLGVIEKMNPRIAAIPNAAGDQMRPIGFRTIPLYLKTGLKTGALAARVIIRRRTRGMGGRQVMTDIPIPPSWIEIVSHGSGVADMFDSSVVRSACAAAESGTHSTDQRRLFETLLTLELLCRGSSRLRSKVVFGPDVNIPS
jgi:asparagine synthetase B (glutamine-hydrolysing)